MTCIVAVGDPVRKITVMGGDRAISDSSGFITQSAHSKVFKSRQYILGYAGSVKFGKLIEHEFKPPKYNQKRDGDLDYFMNTVFVKCLKEFLDEHEFEMFDDKPEIGASTSGLLVGINGRIFEFEYELAAIEFADGYAAIGSANELAIGALSTYKNIYGSDYIEDSIKNALKVAARYSTTCSEPFDIVMITEQEAEDLEKRNGDLK